ncbi:SMI1/KNR4 family protein [Streptoalloteichus hindustanus]|uniref:SMI1-KNR4 cell-wall n=1 Tax=Streptoalloteichus hindustanus TaxID=2017 RepID=A0A1M5AIX2_STRHI|nr:SMI1/KNR4 family protein [Streptoalloteichus hindustanus]SHF30153.1 SMI1-KNR4 cell-wall [Streptoalloteichus hindustanus]
MWRSLLDEAVDDVRFLPPADPEEMTAAERVLGHPLPEDLVSLLSETNGIGDEYDVDSIVWPLHRIVEENLHLRGDDLLRTLYMPFDPLLFFADAGNGDLFAFVLRDGRRDIFVWDHETDSRSMLASSLERFLLGWCTGKLNV